MVLKNVVARSAAARSFPLKEERKKFHLRPKVGASVAGALKSGGCGSVDEKVRLALKPDGLSA